MCCVPVMVSGRANEADYAVRWFMVQIFLTGLTIVMGLVALRASTIDQALKARIFLPTPHHYHPADLVGMARNVTSDWGEKIPSGVSSIWHDHIPSQTGL